jgi:Ca2+/Na+ antiporter
MVHEILIILHATSAVLCFVFGYFTFLPGLTHDSRRRLFGYYLLMLIAMIIFLGGAILSHASQLDRIQRVAFSGLFLLSLYMLLRGVQARAALFAQHDNWFPRYADHIGFTLIALFEGFIIVGGIDLGAPGWLTAAVAVLGVIAGGRVVRRIQAQWTPSRVGL